MAPTLLSLQAHPDDECILTGATLAKAAALGFRTIVVYGTRGDAGQTNADLGGESLGERRVREAQAACTELGVAQIHWLGYDDSGMAGTDTTGNRSAFSNIDPAVAAAAVADLVSSEDIGAVLGYDANGTYGHPDHVQVHHVAHALAAQLGADWVLEATYNREYLAGLPGSDGDLDPTFATSEADLTHFVTGEQWVQTKITAVANHRSQIPDDWDDENPDFDGFKLRFGTEWYIATPTVRDADFAPLADLFEAKERWRAPSTG